jgi:hypothetical protein
MREHYTYNQTRCQETIFLSPALKVRAVREGNLIDYDPVTIASNVRMSGVFLKEGEQVGTIDLTDGRATGRLPR